MSSTSEKIRKVYDKAWEKKLEEIRQRPRNTPLIPYEAHDAGLAAVALAAKWGQW